MSHQKPSTFRFTGLAVALLLLVLVSGKAPASNDNDGWCPVVTSQEDLLELWASTDYYRADINGPVTDCAAALADNSLFQRDEIPDIVQMAMIQAAVEADMPLGTTTAAAIYQSSADALCQDLNYAWPETLSAFALISADSRDLAQCAIVALSTILTGAPVFADLSDNPTDGFAYFGPWGDLDGDSETNLTEWKLALETVGISTTNVNTYGDIEWGLVWENAKRGGPGGDTALQAFLASNGLSLPHSVDLFPLPGAFTSPPPTPPGQLRIVSWNIEFLNTRTPPRTAEQLQALAARMAGFNAAVFCLQEIVEKDVLEQVIAMASPSWRGIYWDSQDAIVYDATKVVLVKSELLEFLASPPYCTYDMDYPDSVYVPFPADRIPVTAVFRSALGSETFRVISYHGHWASQICREYEGLALNRYVTELLAAPNETHRIFIIGDYNGQPGAPPEAQLTTDDLMIAVPSENGDLTSADTVSSIDHITGTPEAMALIPDESLFVVRPRFYGETNRDFRNTYTDHLPLLMEIALPEQLPAAYGHALAVLTMIIALLAVCLEFRIWKRRRN